MTHLLDTHALLWAWTDPSRLGTHARAVIGARSSTLLVSAVSAWEIAVKHRLGKLPGAEGVIAGYGRSVARLGGRSLPVTEDHALLAGGLDWSHRDPFDRMLAAQAMVEGCPLVTQDSAFRDLPGVRIVW